MAQIGLANPFYAKITYDAQGNEIYGVPKRMAKLVSANLTVNVSNASDYADDGVDVTIREFLNGTLSFDINELSNEVRADLLNAEIDENGVLISCGEDSPTPVAVLFQSKSSNGKSRFVCLYSVTFGVPGESYQTKGEQINFQHPTIEGTISRRNKVNTAGKHPWKADVKEGDPGVSAATIANWYNAVYEPGAADDCTLDTLALASVTLSPTFDANTTDYVGTTSAASGTVTATPNSEDAAVAITVNGNSIASGDSVTWNAGANDVEIIVRNGNAYKVYHVIVTKS